MGGSRRSGCGGGGSDRRPNLLLISIDTLRADHLSAYGYERETSPHIDELARGGVLCKTAYSTTSWTLPAHHSMLSGLTISAHGVCDERLWQAVGQEGGPAELPLRGTYLSEVLKRRDYRTAGFYSWKYLEPEFGFGAGFDVWERVWYPIYTHPEHSERFHALRQAGELEALARWQAEEPELFDDQRPTAGEGVDLALDWLEQQGEDPFFLFLHLFDTHDDYVPPPPYDTRFDPDYDGPIDGRNVSGANSPVVPGMDPRDLEHLIALYDGEIAWVDSQIGRLLDRLDELGLAEDTLVILTSDHGEEFFEHGHKTHRTHLYRESVEVPLIFRLPGVLPAGRVVEGPVGLIDIVPTVCNLLDVPAPAVLSGTDLRAILEGEAENGERDYLSELFVFQEGWVPERQVAVHRGDRHDILTFPPGAPARAERFDLAANPLEEGRGSPLEPSDPGVQATLSALRDRTADERAAAPPRDAEVQPLSEADWAEIEALGYGGAAEGGPGGLSDLGRLCLDGCVWPEE